MRQPVRRPVPIVLFARSRAVRGWGILLGLVVLLQFVLSTSSFEVPYRLDVHVAGLPLAALLWGLVVAALSAGSAAEVEEAALRRRLRRLRLFWSGGLVGAATLASWSVAEAAGVVDGAVAARNAAAGAALALIAVVLLGSELAWLPPVVLIACFYFAGVDDTEQPRAWAIWMLPSADVPATVVTAALVVTGVTAYVLRDDARPRMS